LIAPLDFADILYISPILLFVGVAMAGLTAYVTLRLLRTKMTDGCKD
jgi:cell division transport system permease protein